MSESMRQQTYQTARQLFQPKGRPMHIDNTGEFYTLTVSTGEVLGTFQTYEEVLDYIRKMDPTHRGPRCLAPSTPTERQRRGCGR